METIQQRNILIVNKIKVFIGIMVLLMIGLVLNTKLHKNYLSSLVSSSIRSKQAGTVLTMKLLFLNETTPEKLNQYHHKFLNTNSNTGKLEGIFDVLSIGSKFNLDLPLTQHETFIQHPSVRNFIVATEDDDPDPTCYNTTTMLELEKITTRCSNRYKFWQNHNAYNKLTHHFSRSFASIPWLKQKKNPIGWLCAIKRQDYAFIKYMELLQKSNAAIPDYLMIIDGDTYLNINHLYSYFISNSDEDGYVPKSSTPAIFAGCRVRAPVHQLRWTFPYGGFGIYLNRGALKKWVMPIHCNYTKNLDHVELCRRYTTIPPNLETDNANVTIGEGKFFRNGMNLNQVFKLLFDNEDIYCLHGDWFYGYIANYLNISRHVVPKGEFPTVGDGGMSAIFFDGTDRESAVEGVDHDYEKNRTIAENRLHAIMGSEIYKHREVQGLCLNSVGMEKDDEEFVYNGTLYHLVKNPVLMKRLHRDLA